MSVQITNVSAGKGGAVFLIVTEGRTAVHDTGMAYCAPTVVKNIKQILGDRPLDYVLLSHTHYDHAGGLGYLRKAWPSLTAVNTEHGKKVFERPGALRVIRELSIEAAKEYASGEKWQDLDYSDEDMKIDLALGDGGSIDLIAGCDEKINLKAGDAIDLGQEKVILLTTPGHTKCSVTYYFPKEKIMFPSESSGVVNDYGSPKPIKPSILTSYLDALDSIEKCSRYPVERIISPHFGEVPADGVPKYWKWARSAVEEVVALVSGMLREGKSEEEIIQYFIEKYRIGFTAREQPLGAFIINAKATIAVIAREMEM